MFRKILFLIVGGILICSNCGEKDRIESLYQDAEKLESDILKSVNTISQVRGQYETILRDAPGSRFAPLACYKLGKLNEIYGHYDEAIDYYQKLLAQYPEHTISGEGLFNMAQIYELHLDKEEDAITTFQQLVSFYPDNEVAFEGLLRMGQLASKNNKWEDAVNYFQTAVSQYPDHKICDALYFRMGDILQHKIEDKEKANQVFQKLIEIYPTSSWIKYARVRLDELN